MKDWHLLTLAALTPGVKLKYANWMKQKARAKYDPVAARYKVYEKLPPAVAAQCLSIDMRTKGWDVPPDSLVNAVCAERENVKALLMLCSQQDIDGDEYVSEENCAEIYAHLLELHRKDDVMRMARAAAAFCRETREGTPCQA